MTLKEIDGLNVTVDNFGVGANVSTEAAIAGEVIVGVNVGDPAEEDPEEPYNFSQL